MHEKLDDATPMGIKKSKSATQITEYVILSRSKVTTTKSSALCFYFQSLQIIHRFEIIWRIKSFFETETPNHILHMDYT